VIAVDSGLLVLAVNRHTPEHARAATLLESLANGGAEWALPWSAVHEFLAFVTHPHAVAHVLGPEDAWGFIESLSASSSLSFLGTTARHAEACAEEGERRARGERLDEAPRVLRPQHVRDGVRVGDEREELVHGAPRKRPGGAAVRERLEQRDRKSVV